MSPLLYQKQDLFLANISAIIIRNVTVPTKAFWKSLSPYNYHIYGKAVRLYNSSNHPTNLLWLYETDAPPTYYNYYSNTADLSSLSNLFIPLIASTLIWRAVTGVIDLFAEKYYGTTIRKSAYFLLFHVYYLFGMVNKRLNLSARHGHLPNVELCLKGGADVNGTDDHSYVQDFLDFIALLIFLGPVFTLLYYVSILVRPCNNDGKEFIRKKNNGELFMLMHVKAGDAVTPLMWAVRRRHLPVVIFLLQQGADIKRKNVEGKHASEFAVQNLRTSDLEGIENLISIFLALVNADPNWDPSQLLYVIDSNRPLLDILSPKNRIFLLAGIDLTFERISALGYALLFVIIQCDVDGNSVRNEGEGQHNKDGNILEVTNQFFDKLKMNLEVLVKKYPILLSAKDKNGRLAIEIASEPMKLIMQSVRLWHGRYHITDLRPEHVSATCFVFKAVDEHDLDSDGQPIKVALKLMRLKPQFLRELSVRNKGFSHEFVMNVLQTYPVLGSTTFDSWPDEDIDVEADATGQLTKVHAEKFYLLAMPLADRNLFVALKQERWAGKNMEEVRHVFVQLVHCVEHMHEKGVLHADLKTLNIVRTEGQWKLIDLDAACEIGTEPVGHKSSSAYVPPEAIFVDEKTDYACVRSITAVTKGEATYDLLTAHPSFDVWSLGCILYQMVTSDVRPLFQGGQDDNLTDDKGEEDNLFALATWSTEQKQKKLARVVDTSARNLSSQMLHKNPLQRPSLVRVLGHPFLSGKKVARLVGDKPKYDVFLSYRVASDAHHVEKLYNMLTLQGFKVYWDKLCLLPGVNWEQGFCEGLVSSRAFVPLLSRDAINNSNKAWQNFSKLTTDTNCDNVFLEHRLAVELHGLGLIENLFPVFIGDFDATTSEYSHYFGSGCHPSLPEVTVKSVEEKLRHHMESQALGTPIVPDRTVKSAVGCITDCQGAFIVGPTNATFAAAVDSIVKMLTVPPPGPSPRGSAALVNSAKMTPQITLYNTPATGSLRAKPQPSNASAGGGSVFVSTV